MFAASNHLAEAEACTQSIHGKRQAFVAGLRGHPPLKVTCPAIDNHFDATSGGYQVIIPLTAALGAISVNTCLRQPESIPTRRPRIARRV